MSSTSHPDSTTNDSAPSSAIHASALSINKTRNQQAFNRNQELLSAAPASADHSKPSSLTMNPRAPAFAEPVIASSDRFADIAPYMGRIYNADPQTWGSILPWEFPQNGSKKVEEQFLRAAFGDLECHARDYRFLKQVWYDIAKWNFEIRVPAVAKQWLDNNKDIWTDPTLVEFVLKPSAELKTFSFTSADTECYGEKLLSWVVKHIQYLVQLERFEPFDGNAKASTTSEETKAVKPLLQKTDPAKHCRPEPIVVDSKRSRSSEDSRQADVTKSAQLTRVLPVSFESSPSTAPVRPVSSRERLCEFNGSGPSPRIQDGNDPPHMPVVHNRGRGTSGGAGRFSTYSGGSGRFSQKWQQQALFAQPPFQPSPHHHTSFPHATTPPGHMQHRMRVLSGGFPDFMPSQQPPPPGFANASPIPQAGHAPYNNGPSDLPHGFMPSSTPLQAPMNQPGTRQNAYYSFTDRHFGVDERSNGRDGGRCFSGSNMPWPEQTFEMLGPDNHGCKRRESVNMRVCNGRTRGGSLGRGGNKSSRGRNSFSSAGRRDSDIFAGDCSYQHQYSNHARGPPPPKGALSSDARNAKGNGHHSLSLNRRRNTLHQENAQRMRVLSAAPHLPSGLQAPATSLVVPEPPSTATIIGDDVLGPGTVTTSTTRNGSTEDWKSQRMSRDGRSTVNKERLELPVKPIHDPYCREAKQHPERVLTVNLIGGECSHVRKLIVFDVPPTMKLETVAAYFDDLVGPVDKVSRNEVRPNMMPFDRAAFQCWVTFASNSDAKKAIELAQSGKHSFNGGQLRMAVPYEYCIPDHKLYPGFEFTHMQKEQTLSSTRETGNCSRRSQDDGRLPICPGPGHGPVVRIDVADTRSQSNHDKVSAGPSIQATRDNIAINRSSTTTPASSAGPTPKKKKNKKSKKAKMSTEAADVDSAQDAGRGGESSSNALQKGITETVPPELRKASASSTETQFQAASEPSFSPAVTMKAQFPKIALPLSDHNSAARPDLTAYEDSPMVVEQKGPIASAGHELMIGRPHEDASAKDVLTSAGEPKQGRAEVLDQNHDGTPARDLNDLGAHRNRKGKRVVSVDESPDKSDVDDSFHTAAGSPNDRDKHSNQVRGSDACHTTDESTVVAISAAKEMQAGAAIWSSHQSPATTRTAIGDVVMPTSEDSVIREEAVREADLARSRRSAEIEQAAKQLDPASIEVSAPGTTAQRSASTLSAAALTPGFVTASATRAVTSGAVTPSEAAYATAQVLRKDGKPKGPPQTESFSLYSKKNAPKAQKQKPKKGSSRVASNNTDTEDGPSRAVSGTSVPNAQHLVQQDGHPTRTKNALAVSSTLPDSVSSAGVLKEACNSFSAADHEFQHKTVGTTSNVGVAALGSSADHTQLSGKAARSESGVSGAFRPPQSHDPIMQQVSPRFVQKGAQAAATDSKDASPSRANTAPGDTGLVESDEPPFHLPPAFRGENVPRNSVHNGGKHDVSSDNTGHDLVGLGISSTAENPLNTVNDANANSKKKKAKKKKKELKGTDDDRGDGTGLNMDTQMRKPVSTSQPSPFAFKFTSNSPVKLSAHDDVGRITHSGTFSNIISQYHPRDDNSDQSSQTPDGPTAQASREPTPSSTAASEPSPMKKKIELLQGKRASRTVIEAPPVKRPGSVSSKHARRQSSATSTKSSESLASTSIENTRSGPRFLYLYKPKAPSNRVVEVEDDEEEYSEAGALKHNVESDEEDGSLRLLIL